jgi:hypothetical protein
MCNVKSKLPIWIQFYMLVMPCNIGNNFFEWIDPILGWNLVCKIGSIHVNLVLHTPCRSDFR